MITNKDLKRRIIEISYKYKLSHIGSCLTAVDIIEEIFAKKRDDEKFVLSSGHAGLALYCVIEKWKWKDAEAIYNHHGVHPDRCIDCGISVSTGSLGNGLPIAVGMALADRTKNVYCLISDGECSEGSIWESCNIIMDLRLDNLKLYINVNGYSAYRPVFLSDLPNIGIIKATNVHQLPFLHEIDAHYLVMNEEQYKEAMEILK